MNERMTVGMLRSLLAGLPQEAVVLIHGESENYSPLASIETGHWQPGAPELAWFEEGAVGDPGYVQPTGPYVEAVCLLPDW